MILGGKSYVIVIRKLRDWRIKAQGLEDCSIFPTWYLQSQGHKKRSHAPGFKRNSQQFHCVVVGFWLWVFGCGFACGIKYQYKKNKEKYICLFLFIDILFRNQQPTTDNQLPIYYLKGKYQLEGSRSDLTGLLPSSFLANQREPQFPPQMPLSFLWRAMR